MKTIHSNWNLAITYYLTVAFATTIFKVIISLFLVVLLGISLSTISLFLITIIAIWLSVYLSAKWMNKKYIIENKEKIISFSVIYLVIFFVLQSFIFPSFAENIFVKLIRLFTIAELSILQTPTLFIQIIQSILVIALFFFFSKKYLKVSSI